MEKRRKRNMEMYEKVNSEEKEENIEEERYEEFLKAKKSLKKMQEVISPYIKKSER